MSTITIANKIELDENICQGDVFKDVRYSYINDENNEGVEIIEYMFPMAIIISQGCDVISMGEMALTQYGKSTKFMPSILLCPIYDKENAKNANHLSSALNELNIKKIDPKNDFLFSSKEMDIVKNDWHYRYHLLNVSIKEKMVLENAIIDFKHYFCVPASYLIKNRKNRIFHVDDIFSEQITLKFSVYLSRVAIPD